MSSCLPRGAWVAPLRFIALKLAPPQVSGFHTNINTCLKKSSAMLKHTSCKYNAMPAQLTDNWFFTILGISYTLNAQTTGKKKHQPLGFSILKFQSSHPPPKINKSNIKSKVRWFSPYPRGNPPQKKHHSSAHLLCLWKSAWKGPFPQQKSRWTKRGSNEKNNYSNPLSNHWKQKDPVIGFCWFQSFDLFFVPNQNSNWNSLSSGRKVDSGPCHWLRPLPPTQDAGSSAPPGLSVRIVTFFVGNPELNN